MNGHSSLFKEYNFASMAANLDAGKRHTRKISSTTEFKELTKKDAQYQLEAEFEKLLRTCSPDERQFHSYDLKGFEKLYMKFMQGFSTIDWSNIEPLPEKAVNNYKQLEKPEDKEKIKDMLSKLVVVKLNGGLGTSMGKYVFDRQIIELINFIISSDCILSHPTIGCVGPKSLIAVRNDLTFLDLTVQQIEHLNKTYDTDVPLVLMNSFNTDEDTQKVLRKYKGRFSTINQFATAID